MQLQVGRKRLGVALGAGGIRGAAHIGVLRSLEKHKVPVYALSGSSAGALVAAFYATGYSPDQMAQQAISFEGSQLFDPALGWKTWLGATTNALFAWLRVPSRHHLPYPQGLVQGRAWDRWLQRRLGEMLVSEVEMSLALLATDIDSGEGVVFSQHENLWPVTIADQPLAEAVRASSSIPGIFPPVQIAGRTLVDGGVKCSVPASLAGDLGAEVVLAVDLGSDLERDDPVDNIYEIISQSLDIISEELTGYQLQGTADLVLRPVVGAWGWRDWDRLQQLIELGEQAMDDQIPALKALLVAR